MSAFVNSSHNQNQSAPQQFLHIIQRHRDILFDYSKEFSKTQKNLASARENRQLLISVKSDIE